MTRFLMTMEEAIDLVLLALTQGHSGTSGSGRPRPAPWGDLAQALLLLLGRSAPITILGPRHGESWRRPS